MALPIANAGRSPAVKLFSALPVASEALSFSGTPGTGGTSIPHYKSIIIDKPAGSSAALSNTGIAAPNVTNIDTAGTVRVFLKVADDRFDAGLTPDPWLHADNQDYISEPDPRKAPNSAFVDISVKTEHLATEIPAATQRDWRTKYAAMVALVDTLKGDFDAQTIADHDTTATGAELTTLTDGSDASALHTHDTITTNAAVGTSGKIQLATTPADAGNPKAVTRLISVQEQCVFTSDAIAIADGAEVFVFNVPNLADYGAFALRRVRMHFHDGWKGVWNAYKMTSAEWAAATFGASIGTVTAVDETDRDYAELTFTPATSMSSKDLLVIAHATPTATPGAPTKHITCHVEFELQY